MIVLNAGFTILAMFHLAYLGVMFGSQSPEEKDLELQVSKTLMLSAVKLVCVLRMVYSETASIGYSIRGQTWTVCKSHCIYTLYKERKNNPLHKGQLQLVPKLGGFTVRIMCIEVAVMLLDMSLLF